MACDLSIFPTIMMEISKFYFQEPHGPRGALKENFQSIFREPIKGDWWLLICWHVTWTLPVCLKIQPEFPRNFCAEIKMSQICSYVILYGQIKTLRKEMIKQMKHYWLKRHYVRCSVIFHGGKTPLLSLKLIVWKWLTTELK